jgi:hypothetical protein
LERGTSSLSWLVDASTEVAAVDRKYAQLRFVLQRAELLVPSALPHMTNSHFAWMVKRNDTPTLRTWAGGPIDSGS